MSTIPVYHFQTKRLGNIVRIQVYVALVQHAAPELLKAKKDTLPWQTQIEIDRWARGERQRIEEEAKERKPRGFKRDVKATRLFPADYPD